MIYKEFQDIKLSALGMGAMRLPVINGDNSKIDENAVAEMVAYAELMTRTEEGYSYYRQIRYTERAENIMNWLKAHDIILEKWQ